MKRIILTIISLNVLSLFSYSNSWKGLGTEDEPYLISSPQQMAELAEEVNNGTDFQNIFSPSLMILTCLNYIKIH